MLDEVSDNRKVIVSVRVRPKLSTEGSVMHNAERYHPECIHRLGDTGVRIVDTSCVVGAVKQTVQGPPSSNVSVGTVATRSNCFSYDMVFDKDCTQLEVYEETTVDAVDAALRFGCNVSVIAYGQTGSGKTFTVLGTVGDNPLDEDIITPDTGIFLRILKDLLEYADDKANDKHIVLCISVTEIYLDTVRDLLVDTSTGKKTSPLVSLKLVIDDDNVRIPDLTYREICQLEDAVRIYKIASNRRVSRSTDSNDSSSRSHALFNIEVFQQKRVESLNPQPMQLSEILSLRERQQGVPSGSPSNNSSANFMESSKKTPGSDSGRRSKSPTESPSSPRSFNPNNLPIPDISQISNPIIKVGNGMPNIVCSKIVIADLAGSEKLKHSNSKGTSFDEMKKINGSLTALGNVVHSLYTGSKHIPYRDSKLTVLLRTYFASKTCRIIMIANVSPTSLSFDETQSTMFFADKVKTIKTENNANSALYSAATEAARIEAEVLRLQKDIEDVSCDMRILRGAYFGHRPVARVFLRGDSVKSSLIEDQDKLKVFQEGSIYGARPTEKGAGNNKDVLALPKGIMKAIIEDAAVAAAAKRAEYQKALEAELEAALERGVAEYMKDYSIRRDEAKKSYAEQVKSGDEATKEYNIVAGALRRNIESVEKILGSLDNEVTGYQEKKRNILVASEEAAVNERELTSRLKRIEDEFAFHNKGEQESWIKFNKNLELEDRRHGIYMTYFQKRLAYIVTRKQYIVSLTDTAHKKNEVIGAQMLLERYDTTRWIVSALNIMVGNAVLRSLKKSARQADCRRESHVDPYFQIESDVVTSPRRRVKSTFDDPNLLNWINIYMSNGCSLLKYRSNGVPHYRRFHLIINEETSSVRLYWDAENSTRVPGDSACSYVDLFNVTKIVLGKCSDVFSRSRDEKQKLKFSQSSNGSSSLFREEDYYTSFTVYFMKGDEEKTLNITCETVAEMEAWVAGLCNISQVNPFFGHRLCFASTDGESQSQYINSDNKREGRDKSGNILIQMLDGPEYNHLREYCTSDAELLLCERWHIHPKLWHATKTRIIVISQSQSSNTIRNGNGTSTPSCQSQSVVGHSAGTLSEVYEHFVPVVMTPGELRQMMQIDIFRANACWLLLVAEGFIERPLNGCMSFLDFDK